MCERVERAKKEDRQQASAVRGRGVDTLLLLQHSVCLTVSRMAAHPRPASAVAERPLPVLVARPLSSRCQAAPLPDKGSVLAIQLFSPSPSLSSPSPSCVLLER